MTDGIILAVAQDDTGSLAVMALGEAVPGLEQKTWQAADTDTLAREATRWIVSHGYVQVGGWQVSPSPLDSSREQRICCRFI